MKFKQFDRKIMNPLATDFHLYKMFASQRYENGELRVTAVGPSFQSLLAGAFDQIRESAKGNLAIVLEMLNVLQTIASLTAGLGRRKSLREQVERIAELAGRTIKSPHDRDRLETRLAEVREAPERNPLAGPSRHGVDTP